MRTTYLLTGCLALSLLCTNFAAADVSIPRPPSTPYEAVRNLLRDLEKKYPNNAKVFQIGVNDAGQGIEGLMIGSGPVKNLVVGTHHGNEYGATEVAKAFASALAEQPIKGQTIYVIPVLNIGGYNLGNRYERTKGNAFDPNRDYPGPCGSEGPFNLKSTNALAQFIDREQIVASATLHTYSPAVVYPWGFAADNLSTPYDDLFKQLVEAATVESHYATGNSTEVIYPADGTFEDYAFWKHGVWSILFELGFSHNPTPGDVAELNRVNVPGLRRMLEQAPRERAENHAFTGKCNLGLRALDRHDE